VGRSNHFVVHSNLDVNFWAAAPPSVEAARPGRCPRCGAASRPPGAALVLHGHGIRARQVRGPRTVRGAPATITITARRFLCQACRAVITVVPRGVVRHRHFAGSAIALALFLFGVLGRTASAVQRAISGWGDGASSWRTLTRWIDAASEGRLFRWPRADLSDLRRRAVARAVARFVQAGAACSAGDEVEQVFDAAASSA
jgi:hypothetical protein